MIPPSFRDYVSKYLSSTSQHSKVILVDGGETRHRSIWNGIKKLREIRTEEQKTTKLREKDDSCETSLESPAPKRPKNSQDSELFENRNSDKNKGCAETQNGDNRHLRDYDKSGHNESSAVDSPSEVVVIHDAARPFLDTVTLNSVIGAAFEHGVAGVVRPLVSTVVKPDRNGFLQETLVRADYRASEMPQVRHLHRLDSN